jgi:hypothetical protein
MKFQVINTRILQVNGYSPATVMLEYTSTQQCLDQTLQDHLMGNSLKEMVPNLPMTERFTISEGEDNISKLEDPMTTIGMELQFLHLSEHDEQRSTLHDCWIQKHICYRNDTQWTSSKSGDTEI